MRSIPNIVRIRFSDGREFALPFKSDKVEFQAVGSVYFETDEDGVITPKIVPCADIYPEKLSVEISLAACSDDTWVYLSDYVTNAMTEVKKLSLLKKEYMKEIGCLKDKRSGLSCNVGVVTANRIYTNVIVTPQILSVEYDLEERRIAAGDELTLESFFTSDLDIYDFLDLHTQMIIKYNKVRPLKEPLVGWCSWSCYYQHVNEEKIQNAIEDMSSVDAASVVQIDAGWQNGGIHSGDWYYDEEKFPNGIRPLAEKANSKKIKFGLWVSPFLVAETSPYYESLKDIILLDKVSNGCKHPFDLDNPAYYEHLTKVFRRMHEEYGADYFKLDFMIDSYFTWEGHEKLIRYKSDYRIALFRKALQTIRDAVGEETILLCCTTPMLECVGIFDAQRVAGDIIVTGKEKHLPTYWELIRRVSKTVLYRSYYNGKIFRNDPDGIVVRDVEIGDGFDCKYHEARFWATTAAMSGGLILLNEEYRNLSPARRALFDKLLPPHGKSGQFVDFFDENLHPRAAVLDFDEKTKYLALYNCEDEITDITYELSDIGCGESIVIDCWEGKVLDVTDCIELNKCMPHSAYLLCIVPIPKEPEFLYEDSNVWLGRTGDVGGAPRYIVYPDGFDIPADSNVMYKNKGITVVKE